MHSRDGRGPVWLMLASTAVLALLLLVFGTRGQDRTVQTTPPTPEFVATSDRIAWTGAMCLHLDRWTGTEWAGVASASFEDAERGVWGGRTYGVTFCDMARVEGSPVSLPSGIGSGVYRMCSFSGDDCMDFSYEP